MTQLRPREDFFTVFVYGTLRRGQSRAHVMEAGGQFVCETQTVEGFRLVDLGSFPAMIEEGSGRVRGELWVVTRQTLEQLDRIEGHPTFYQRRVVYTKSRFGTQQRAWAYLLTAGECDRAERIVSGDWVEHQAAKKGGVGQ